MRGIQIVTPLTRTRC